MQLSILLRERLRRLRHVGYTGTFSVAVDVSVVNSVSLNIALLSID